MRGLHAAANDGVSNSPNVAGATELVNRGESDDICRLF